MAVDYPPAIDMLLPLNYSFDTIDHLEIVEHCTGGDMTIEAVHDTFLASMRSTHFAIGRDGRVAQFVPLNRGAGGNCCPDTSHNSYWDKYIPSYFPDMSGGLNRCTISIEHCNDKQQSLQLTPAQMDASKKLNLWLCQKYGITTDHIHGHNSIDATNCPGSVFYSTYWQQLMDYIKSGGVNKVPTPNQQQQFDTTWDVWFTMMQAMFPLEKIQLARKGTGIYNVFIQAHVQGHELGACTSYEYPNNDWNGNPIICQSFEHAIIQWQNGAGRIFGAYGEIKLT